MKSLVVKVHWDTLTHFVYVPDKILHPDHFDRWISFADQVERGEIFHGDCDDVSLTTAELSIRRGADPAVTRLIYCRTETGGAHLVTGVGHWILDNRHRTVMYWKDLPYEWITAMVMNEKGIWRKV